MKTFDEVLAYLLTPTLPKYACSYDGMTVDHFDRPNPHVVDYCYRHGLVVPSKNKAYRYYARILAPDGTTVIQLWWGPEYPRLAYTRVRINPSTGGLSAGQFTCLVALICGSEDALEFVRVVRMDLKIDIPDVTVDMMDRHVLVDYARRYRKIFGMVCINSRKGTAQLVIYDVGAKRGEGPGRLIRLEYRRRFTTRPGKERPLFLDLMVGVYLDDNLFKRVSMAQTGVLDKRTREGRLVGTHGATKTYLTLDLEARRRFKQQILKAVPEHRSLAEVFTWEAEQWHETLDSMGVWLAQVDRFLDHGSKKNRRPAAS